ncbi:hypothetical protein HOD30_03205 [Candidatus Peregrinibacteria bacterium]|jgi:hypothetical protein|nr:hypothetical protein [Candidatus Peregrinibacteria bacterium]MBT4631685.1 hypothetical protein [Candidatus Peregrinibacteria bacterium]MBT5517114.1 hypothetical protein [Candidatus Peregrinibacteria bacterium]MBT5824252.1 hypothetical protein [Candidatus Peregrinibacteria bacterium]
MAKRRPGHDRESASLNLVMTDEEKAAIDALLQAGVRSTPPPRRPLPFIGKKHPADVLARINARTRQVEDEGGE